MPVCRLTLTIVGAKGFVECELHLAALGIEWAFLALAHDRMIELTTSRLRMRQLAKADRDLFFLLHRDVAVMHYVSEELPDDMEIEERFESRLAAWHGNAGHWLCLTVFTLANNRAIGVTGLRLSGDNPLHAEVGYLFLPQYQGKGYGAESLRAVKNYARDIVGLVQLTATVAEDNLGSRGVLEKCGFTCNRRIPGGFRGKDKICDELIYRCEM